MDGQPKTVADDDASSLEGGVETPIERRKIPNDDSSCTSAISNYFVIKNVMVLIILIIWIIMITW